MFWREVGWNCALTNDKFKGKENVLELSRPYRVAFVCTYDMALFPFDTQTCSMNFMQNEVTINY